MALVISTLGGGETKVEDTELEQFRAGIQGDVLTPDDDGYDANPIYNAMHNGVQRSGCERPARPTLSTPSTSLARGTCWSR